MKKRTNPDSARTSLTITVKTYSVPLLFIAGSLQQTHLELFDLVHAACDKENAENHGPERESQTHTVYKICQNRFFRLYEQYNKMRE